jgi:nucleotide-binding universal stress UspA family protein
MRWIVGIDLLEHARGALQMAAWLRTRRRPECEQDFVAVHVLDEAVRGWAKGDELAALVVRAHAALREAIAPSNVASPFVDLEVVLAPDPSEGLAQASSRAGIDGVMVGRVAPRDARSLVRLGRVTRQLLRRLPAPVMVVPPDLPRAEIGEGPVLVATDLLERSIPAARLARRLADELGRPLRVAHVDSTVHVIPSFIDGGALVSVGVPKHTLADLEAWIAGAGLGDAEPCLLDGAIVDAVLTEAARIDAPVVVCGAEHISPLERLFGASVAGDLARLADRAVLAVPAV